MYQCVHADGKAICRVLSNVKITPSAHNKIFTLTQKLSSEVEHYNDLDENLVLNYTNRDILTFDKCQHTRSSWVGGLNIFPETDNQAIKGLNKGLQT